MKKTLVGMGIFALCTMIAGCAISGPKQNDESQKKVAIVSGHPDRKPIMYKSGESIAGIGVEVMQSVFKDLGVDVSPIYAGARDVVQEKAKNWEIDAIVALYKTNEREQYLDYSIAYTQDPIVLFFSGGKSFAYTGKENLVGKKGIATVGDSYGQEIDDYILSAPLDMARVDTPQQAFASLKDGKEDYFIYSLYAGRRVIEEWAFTGIEESSVVSNQPFYIGISKKSPYAKNMNEINASLQKMIDGNMIPKE